MARLTGKVALVTGAAKGIGLSIAELFIKEGAQVVLTDIDVEHGQAAADKLGKQARFIKQDVTSESEWLAVYDQIHKDCGQLDVLVNNAGVGVLHSIEETDFEEWRRLIAINLDSVFLGTKYGIEQMKSQGGSIVNISSIAGLVGDPNLLAYNAAKGGVRMLTKSAALLCAEKQYHIRINSIHPGYISTPLVQGQMRDDPDLKDHLLKLHPMGRLGKPEEIAEMALFLASDESSFSTGSEFIADGGYTAQ